MHAANFHLTPSKLYLATFGAIVLVSVMILCNLPIPIWLKLLGITVILAHGSRVAWRYALLRDRLSITDIQYTDEKRWVVQNQEGAFVAELLGDSTVTSFVMLLHFRIRGKMLPLKSIIFRDSLSADEYRQLLVILR